MISKWKKSDTDLKWTSRCTAGVVSICGLDNGKFVCRDPNGMLVSQFPEKSFEDAVRFMESVFSWRVWNNYEKSYCSQTNS